MQADGGLSVFRYYGFEPSKRPQKQNPFRQERTSSFFIGEKAGKYFFKDFGDDTFKGNAWRFVELYENTQEKKRIFEILCGIYGLTLLPTNIRKVLPAPIDNFKAPISGAGGLFEKKLHSIEFQSFSKQELDFWYQKGLISQEALEANRVQSVKSFKIEVSAGKFAQYDNLRFIFAYEILKGEAYKLYMPKAEYRVYAKSKTVFLPNLQPAKQIFGEKFTYTFGLDTLRPEPFLLCGGEPDCLALKSLGYNAFTLGDERASVPEYVWEYLRETWDIENPKSLLQAVLYDTDYTGIMHSRKLAKALQVPALVLPKLYTQTSPEQPKPTQNDLCDYLGLYGFDAPLQRTLHKRHTRTRDYTLPAVPFFQVERYLSEKTDVLADFIRSHKRVQVDADTGVGKTFTFLVDLPERLQKPILFAVPFAIQVEQIEQEYNDKAESLMCFTNQDTQALSEEDKFILMNRPTGKVNVCTIDRIKAVYERLELEFGNDLIIVIDESHLLTSEYGYRMQAIHDVLEVCRKVEKVVYLSATPDYSLCQFSGFRLIQFRRQVNPCLQVQAVDYEGSPKHGLLKLLTSLPPFWRQEGTNPPLQNGEQISHLQNREGAGGEVTVIRLNNKTLAKVIANLLITDGVYKTEEIDFVFSEKRKGQSTPSRERIIQHSLIPENVRLLFVTACFDCGINIKNTNIAQIISFETQYTDNCLDTLKQFVARFRDMKNINVMVCKPKRYTDLPALKSKATLYERLAQDAQAKLHLLPYLDSAQETQLKTPFAKLPAYLKHNPDISAIHRLIYWHKRKQTYQINYNYIRFAVKEYERKNLNSFDFYTLLQQELPCLTLVGRQALQNQVGKDKNNKLVELLALEKQKKEQIQTVITQVMQENPTMFFDAVCAAYRDQSLKEKIKKHFAVSNPKDAPKLEMVLTTLKPSLEGEEATTPPFKEGQEVVIQGTFDEELTTLSHRYFYLLDLRVPQSKIPSLLKTYSSQAHFTELTKTLNNHIQLLAYQEAGENWTQLSPDARKGIDAKWLTDFMTKVPTWIAPHFMQKKNNTLRKKLQNATERLQTLKTEHENAQKTLADLQEREKLGEKCRSILRDAQRKETSASNRLHKQANHLQDLQNQTEQSTIIGWEISQLSDRINRTRLHASDWQSPKINIRLLQSLFETHTQKRAVLLPNPNNPQENIYVEKTFITVGLPLTFENVLEKIGFQLDETERYLQDLRYQIHLDIQSNSAKNNGKSHDTSKELFSIGTQSENAILPAQMSNVLVNENGYPLSWDL
jgi:hypothetical protein